MVVGTAGPVAIWASSASKPIKLAGLSHYRLDYLEIDPRHRGQILGAFVISLVACRALELGAVGVVLAAFPIPGLVEFYEAVGAARGVPRGWNHPKELVALSFELPVLERLKDLADGLIEENQG